MSCHSIINPLGFALESFDAVGRWRTVDNNKPVDTQSEYTTQQGDKLKIDSARDIARLALSNSMAHRAFVTQVFQQVAKQDPANFGPNVIDHLTEQFVADDFHIQRLWMSAAATAAKSSRHHISSKQDKLTSIQR
jgi:hypothetical protein